jgi:diguanylate cyclase (GGDEF)-like protein
MADISKRLDKADKYLQKGKIEDALEELMSALDEDPNNEGVQQRAADLCISLGRTKEAVSLLASLFDRQSGIGDMAKANITYKKLVRIAQPTPEQVLRWAQFTEKSNKKEALEAYHKALDGFVAAKNKTGTLNVLKRMVALEPTLENYQREGELAAEFGEGKVACAAFYQVGLLEQEAKHDPLAWFQSAYSHDPTNADAALAYSWELIKHGKAQDALVIIEPYGKPANALPPFREAYGRALLNLKRNQEAEPIVWELFLKDPKQIDEVALLIGGMIDAEHYHEALVLTQKLDAHEDKAGRRRELVSLLKEVCDEHPANAEFLEYMVGLYNANNREHDYCDTLVRLFQLYYAAGNFLKAGDSLDAAAEVDPYEQGHQKRLEMLKGKIDANRYRAIANRFSGTAKDAPEAADEKPVDAGEPTILEDFMLQAEIFLQYGMRSKAMERLERVGKLFPHEEDKNEKLRALYGSAGFTPKYDAPASTSAAVGAPSTIAVQAATVATPTPVATPAVAGIKPSRSVPANDETAVDNIARVTEITRNIYRQANVKAVLFAAVNDIGRHWGASRCVAGLCTPGKPPSAALEYCAPNIKQSDVMAIVKLIQTLQALAVRKGTVAIDAVTANPELAAVKQYTDALQIESILAVPLVDGDEHQGMLFLEQCGTPRAWRPTDALVLKTIADQMMLAVNNAKLRSLMKTLAVTDEKSGLLKRSSYIDVLLSETRRSIQQSAPMTVMLLHFGRSGAMVKELGESVVEGMMQQIGQIVCSHIRQNDVAVRYFPTTIAVVLADTNDKNAFFVVDKLRKALAGIKIPGKDVPPLMTVGIASAVMNPKFDPVDIVTEVINRADAALDRAKVEGPTQALAPQYETAAVA